MHLVKRSIALVGFVSVLLTGCSKSEAPKDIVKEEIGNQDSLVQMNPTKMNEDSERSEEIATVLTSTEGVDVDLTTLSSSMVFAEVYHMVSNPKDYIGKVVRMAGPYYKSYYEETKQNYHYIIIEDAGACCTSGIEFKYMEQPTTYPKDGDQVEVTGIFRSYEELGQTYFYLEVEQVAMK